MPWLEDEGRKEGYFEKLVEKHEFRKAVGMNKHVGVGSTKPNSSLPPSPITHLSSTGARTT